MPRYFFHVQDGQDYTDLQGAVLEDLEAARREAVRVAAALLAEHHEKFWDAGEWSMQVVNDQNMTLFQLTFFVTESAVISKS